MYGSSRKMEKKSSFENLAEDGTNLVEKYCKKKLAGGITRSMSNHVTFEKIWVKCCTHDDHCPSERTVVHGLGCRCKYGQSYWKFGIG